MKKREEHRAQVDEEMAKQDSDEKGIKEN